MDFIFGIVTETGTCQAEQTDIIKRESIFSNYNIFLSVIVSETVVTDVQCHSQFALT